MGHKFSVIVIEKNDVISFYLEKALNNLGFSGILAYKHIVDAIFDLDTENANLIVFVLDLGA